jgi:hypothetical protein
VPHRLAVAVLLLAPTVRADDARAKEFHRRAQEPTGVLVPLYVYPAAGADTPAFARLADLKRRYETVPVWAIVNPASGPGPKADPNYERAIGRLVGAGVVPLGYVTTGYGKRPAADVRAEVERWHRLYPRVTGVFFDEMGYEDTAAAAEHQAALTRHAHAAGFWPAVANPGTDTPARYFAAAAADVIVVHEGDRWPADRRMDRYAEYPPFTRGVLVHSHAKLDTAALAAARRHARWVYATDAPFRAGDPAAANPWDRLPTYLDELFAAVAGR